MAKVIMPPNAMADIARAHGIPPALFAALVHQESGGNATIVSPAGAVGLTQLMPQTAASLGVTNPRDPIQNLNGGAKYLKEQYDKFGRWDLALAAYNAGPGAVASHGGIPPYAETQAYVKNIMAMAGHLPAGAAQLPATTPGATAAPQQISPQGPQAPSLNLQDAMAPSPLYQDLLGRLSQGSNALQQAQEEAAMPIPTPPQAQAPTNGTSSQNGQASQGIPQLPDPNDVHHTPVSGLSGEVPMFVGGPNPYPNLKFSGHVDFHHVNPYLLQTLQKEAEKRGVSISIISGYRSNKYSASVGGFKGDPHTKGIAVDAYVNGHPIGEVIPPDVWSKLGIRSGAADTNFYHGKSDPEHLDLVGMPVKGAKK